jgi:V/A-type H+-transporting ATPase subunit I
MVVKMKHLELLLYHKEREQFLESLRKLGVVHLVESETAVESSEIQPLAAQVRRCERVLQNLKKLSNEKKDKTDKVESLSAQDVLDKYDALEEQREKLTQELQVLEKDRDQMEPWGTFDLSLLKTLSDARVKIRFFTTLAKKFTTIESLSDSTIIKVNEVDGTVYFIVIEYGSEVSIEADEVRLPELALSDIVSKVAQINNQLIDVEAGIFKLVSSIAVLDEYRKTVGNQLIYKKAHLSMAGHADGTLLHMSGWFPAERENAITSFLKNYSAWFDMREPVSSDNVPVKLKNAAFPKLFEPITGLYSLPHYTELDITPFMAPFFSFFFGLCLGDVGYGAILFIGALILLSKAGPKIKPFAWLGIVLSISTIVSGVLLNSFFGKAIFGGPGVEGAFLSSGVNVFSPLASMTTEKGSVFPAMGLALVLGFVQILFGMTLQMIIRAANSGLVAGIQPLASMMMIVGGLVWAAHVNFLNLGIGEFTVGPVLIGKMLLSISVLVAKGLTWGGLVLFFFFNNIDKKIFIRPAIGLWEFYQFTTGILGDVLSYLRLFALGLAGGLLGAAFNQIAFMFITGKDGVVNYASAGIIGTVLILILGHSLNLGLSIIGSFVHPLRLTFVEFYKNIGFKGGSKPFIPFAKVE